MDYAVSKPDNNTEHLLWNNQWCSVVLVQSVQLIQLGLIVKCVYGIQGKWFWHIWFPLDFFSILLLLQWPAIACKPLQVLQ